MPEKIKRLRSRISALQFKADLILERAKKYSFLDTAIRLAMGHNGEDSRTEAVLARKWRLFLVLLQLRQMQRNLRKRASIIQREMETYLDKDTDNEHTQRPRDTVQDPD